MIDFIDLGCGEGGSIEWAKARFGGETHIGFDSNPKHIENAVKNGYTAVCLDVSSYNVAFPSARYVSMLHFAEHLKNEEALYGVLKKSLEAASEFVFIKVPYFGSWEYLKNLGFKLTWTDWAGHPVAVTEEMLHRIVAKLGAPAIIGNISPIEDSNSSEVIPFSSPVDTIVYNDSLGVKEYVKFNNVYRETFCFINNNCPYWDVIKEKNIT